MADRAPPPSDPVGPVNDRPSPSSPPGAESPLGFELGEDGAAAITAVARPRSSAAWAAGAARALTRFGDLRQALFAPGALPCDARERLIVTSILLVVCFGGYYLLGLTQDPSRAATLNTALDDAIPCVPLFMHAYVLVYTALSFPLFVARCQRLFRRIAAGYGLVILGCLLVWAVYPVTAIGLRADVSALDMTRFEEWGLRVNYTLDPPMNLFPSLHMAIALLAALGAWRADRRVGACALVGAALVGVAICTVKQHYLADAVGGAALALLAYVTFVRSYDPAGAAPEQVAFSWRGPAGYLAFHGTVLGGLYAAFLAGWEPWA